MHAHAAVWTELGIFKRSLNWFLSFLGSEGRVCLHCRRPGFDPWVRKILWRRKWQPTPVFLPGKSHGQRSLSGYRVAKSRTRLSNFTLNFTFFQLVLMYSYAWEPHSNLFCEQMNKHARNLSLPQFLHDMCGAETGLE